MASRHTSPQVTVGAAQAGRRRAVGDGQAGQTLPLFVVFLVVLLGMCALAIDVGFWAQGKRSTQNSADASALAGAAFLGVNWSTAQTNASSEFAKNMASGDTATYTPGTTYIPNDTIQVTVNRQAQTFFAKVFGKNSVSLVSTARATMVQNGGGALPWAVMNNPYVPGNTYQIYTDNSGPNNGAVRLPAWDTATSACTTGNVNGLGGAQLQRLAAQHRLGPRLGRVVARKDLDQRRLARAVLAQQCVHLAPAQLQTDLIEGALALEDLREALQGQHRLGVQRAGRHQPPTFQAFLNVSL